MSQRPSSNRSTSARNRSSDSCKRRQREVPGCEVEDPKEEEYVEMEPRYDPKELRDAAKILEPFLRLLGETNNPFASIVAKELCKTFYHLYHPGMHPADVNKTINWKAKEIRSCQLWTEFWQYIPNGEVKEWRSLWCAGGDLIDIDENRFQTPRPPAYKNPCPNAPKRSEKLRSRNKNPTCEPNVPRSLIEFYEPDCNHQAAGSDLTELPPCTLNPSSTNTTNVGEKLDSKRILDQITESKRELERLVDAACKKCLIVDPDQSIFEGNEVNDLVRQPAGNDSPRSTQSYCQPEVSTWSPTMRPPEEYEYYLRTGTSLPLPQQNALGRLSNPGLAFVEPELQNNENCEEECDINENAFPINDIDLSAIEMPSFNEEIEFNAEMLDNAFTNVSLAEQELEKKKTAFNVLVDNYVEFAQNPMELEPPCPKSKSAKKILRAIYRNPPRILQPFDDSRWNTNALRDRDFVKLLPFFEVVHNQLEHASKKQFEKGINMLDDVMSVLFHIHYDLGDPRLKNEIVVDHVKLITKNTWKFYFYPDATRRMPEIPEKPLPQLNSPNQQSSNNSNPRFQSPVLQNTPKPPAPARRPPSQAKLAPKSPAHARPSGHGPLGHKSPLPPPVNTTNLSQRRPQTANARLTNNRSTASDSESTQPQGNYEKVKFRKKLNYSTLPLE